MWPKIIEARPKRAKSMGHGTICEEMNGLQQTVQNAERSAEAIRKARLIAEEKARRTVKMLEDVSRESRSIKEENRVLTKKIAELQAGLEILTDEQAKQEMGLLYNDLKQWSFTHFQGVLIVGEGDHTREREEIHDICSLSVIQAEIAGMIYCSFWAIFNVGYGAHWHEHFRRLDQEIKKLCASHVARHWRAAMSTATVSLGSPSLQTRCNQIIDKTERLFGQFSVTERSRRTHQLNNILWRCIQFKQKLECQEDTYILWRSHSRTPFRDERMHSLTDSTDEIGPGKWVELSLWPCLNKVRPTGEWSVIQKEIITPSSPSIMVVDPTNELDLEHGDEEI